MTPIEQADLCGAARRRRLNLPGFAGPPAISGLQVVAIGCHAPAIAQRAEELSLIKRV